MLGLIPPAKKTRDGACAVLALSGAIGGGGGAGGPPRLVSCSKMDA